MTTTTNLEIAHKINELITESALDKAEQKRLLSWTLLTAYNLDADKYERTNTTGKPLLGGSRHV